MKSNFQAVDWFVTTIKAASSIPATGTSGSFSVTSKSVNGETLADGDYFFYVTIKGEDSTKREIFRIWRVAGDVLYFDRRRSPVGMFLHAAGESVQVNDVAEAINLAFETIDDFGKTEDNGGLAVKISGGKVQIGTTSYTVSTTTLTLADNSSLSVVFDTSDRTFKSTATVGANHIIVATVTTSGGDISVLTDMRPYSYVSLSNTPGSSTATVSYGLAKSDGTLTTYARADHTHGTPGVPTAGQLNGTMDDQARGIKNGAWVSVAEPGGQSSTPAPSGAVASDEGTYWKLTYSDGTYVEYRTDGIHNFDSLGNQISFQADTGTYSASGMTYTGGTTLNDDGSITAAVTYPAYVDKQNIFQQYNQFENGALFKKTVYGQLLTTTATVDWSLGNVQKISISSPTALTFTNLSPGTVFSLFIASSGTAAISSITCTKVGGGSLTTDTVGGTVPDITAHGGYILPIFVGETAAHIFKNGPTESI